MNSPDPRRVAFEAWAQSHWGLPVEWDGHGVPYRVDSRVNPTNIESHWIVWQACHDIAYAEGRKDGVREGAEGMRSEAVRYCATAYYGLGLPLEARTARNLARLIEALPLPGDESEVG